MWPSSFTPEGAEMALRPSNAPRVNRAPLFLTCANSCSSAFWSAWFTTTGSRFATALWGDRTSRSSKQSPPAEELFSRPSAGRGIRVHDSMQTLILPTNGCNDIVHFLSESSVITGRAISRMSRCV